MMSNLPKQVQDAADEAARLEQSLQPPPAEGDAAPAPDAPEPAKAVQTPDPAPTPKVHEIPKADEASWQQRYLTLQGMYNAEVPRMNRQIQDLNAQLQDAVSKINAPKESPKAPDAPKPKQGTDKDVETFGGDLIDLIRRQSADLVQAERDRFEVDMQKLQSENAELKKQMGTVTERQGNSARFAYLGELAKQVPDYEALNVNQDFLGWLAEVDPLSGVARQAYLNNAWETFDVVRTANLFKAFKEKTGVTPSPQPAPSPQQELARQVAPGTSKSSAPPAPDNASERIWTTQQIEAFYTDVTKGLYSGEKKRVEAARIEAEIDAAVATGRVR